MQRVFAKIIKEICEEEGIFYKSFSYSWVFDLEYNGIARRIIGHQFDLNAASAVLICKDKCAASDILHYRKVPRVGHELFLNPTSGDYTEGAGNWERIQNLLKEHSKLVFKPNEGTGGVGVFAASTQTEVERAVEKIFKFSRTMAVCPYYEIENEYRAVALKGKTKLIFLKDRAYISGDGVNTINTLITEKYKDALSDYAEELRPSKENIILDKGQKLYLKWKHNLCEGALPLVIKEGEPYLTVSKIAEAAVSALNIDFASVDVVETGGNFMVLEVNGGVMMEYFASSSEENYQTAKNIYKEAVKLMMEKS